VDREAAVRFLRDHSQFFNFYMDLELQSAAYLQPHNSLVTSSSCFDTGIR
jgi:hypothetical protein